MSVTDPAQNARAKKIQKSKFKRTRALKARQCKVSNTVIKDNTNATIATQSRFIKKLQKQIQILKAQITKLERKSLANAVNQSTNDKLHQIYVDINQIMSDMHVTTNGKTYNR